MWNNIIAYFSKKHILANLITLSVIFSGFFFWHNTPKEELPNIEFDTIRISAHYPGASPGEVEYFVTKPIEDAVKGIDGIYEIVSMSNEGSSSITVSLEQNYSDRDESIIEIRNAVLDVRLPDEIIDDPNIREFKTSRKAIVDVAIFNQDYHLLDYEDRKELQSFVLAIENQLLSLAEVSEVRRKGFLDEEIQIKVDPKKLMRYNISFNKIIREIKNNNVRQPAGSIEDKEESKVTLIAELDNPEKLKNLIIEGGFEGQSVKLKNIADVKRAYTKNKSITKINGHEGIILNVVKNGSKGILEAIKKVNITVNNFQNNNIKDSNIKIILLDDESKDVRNRLSIVKTNGIIGFSLILLMLFLFLDFKSGLWVAIGIPFSFCFSMTLMAFFGFTINNVTLSAIIIVMGMVVDDAIVVAENISRQRTHGVSFEEASVKGTTYVLLPIIASIITTCVAFIPLFYFPGRFGKFNAFIPPHNFFHVRRKLI